MTIYANHLLRKIKYPRILDYKNSAPGATCVGKAYGKDSVRLFFTTEKDSIFQQFYIDVPFKKAEKLARSIMEVISKKKK